MSPPKSGWLFLGRMRNRLLLKLNHGVKVRPDKAFAIAMQPAERVKPRRAFVAPAEPLQTDFKPVERQVATTDFARSRSSLERVDAVTVH
jgi:hypothetical protein